MFWKNENKTGQPRFVSLFLKQNFCFRDALGLFFSLAELNNNKYHSQEQGGASPVERRGLGWFQEAGVTCSGAGMGS